MTLDEFFANRPVSRALFEVVRREVEALGPVEIAVTKSQVTFRRSRPVARVWLPEQYLRRKAAPLVLVFGFRRRDPSPRWKSVVEPSPGRFTHHLELYSEADIDDEVRGWLREAWEAAA